VLAPGGPEVTAASVTRHIDNAMVKAIARALRWRDMLESGEHATIRETADAERIDDTYVGRVLRLTLLAPDTVEAIVNGRQPVDLLFRCCSGKSRCPGRSKEGHPAKAFQAVAN